MGKKIVSNRHIDHHAFVKLRTFRERASFLLQYAIQAPSTHNTQPWLFRITQNSIQLYKDEKYALAEGDPVGRDMYISLGCALENLLIAAKHFSVFESIAYTSRDSMVAEVFLSQSGTDVSDKKPSALLRAIPLWQNSRGEFDSERVESALLENLQSISSNEYFSDDLYIDFITDKNSRSHIASLTREGVKIAHSNSKFRREMSTWMNTSTSKKNDGIPGYALKMPLIASYLIPTVIRWVNLGKVLGVKSGEGIRTAPLIAIISSRVDTGEIWLKTGQLSQRIMLELHSAGYDTSIYVAAVEIGSLRFALQAKLHDSKLVPNFLFAAGKIDSHHPLTPRHGVEDKMLD